MLIFVGSDQTGHRPEDDQGWFFAIVQPRNCQMNPNEIMTYVIVYYWTTVSCIFSFAAINKSSKGTEHTRGQERGAHLYRLETASALPCSVGQKGGGRASTRAALWAGWCRGRKLQHDAQIVAQIIQHGGIRSFSCMEVYLKTSQALCPALSAEGLSRDSLRSYIGMRSEKRVRTSPVDS